jgi:hypothetical protein
MNTGLLSLLLIADSNTSESDIRQINAAVMTAKTLYSEHDLVLVTNGGSPEVMKAISSAVASLENAKLVCLAQEADPDAAIMIGLQRSIGDLVLIGSVSDIPLELVDEMIARSQEGHEVVVAEHQYKGVTYSPERTNYSARLLSRAAVHFVIHAGASERAAYHLLPRHQLFNPVFVSHEASKKPAQSIVRGLRRRWRSLISSQVTPLRIASGMALFGAMANIVYSMYVIVLYMIKDTVAPGWVTLSLQSSGMFMLFSMALFVLTEYLIGLVRANQLNQSTRIVREERSRNVTFDRENLECL